MSLLARFQSVVMLITFLFLTACGGGGGSPGNVNSSQIPSDAAGSNQLFIAGGGIKGPLAFATVELYAADTRFDQLYNPAQPLASATTNAYAQITGLPVPRDVPPPYILVIDGSNATDLNTGVAPVLHKLVTVITQASLNARQPIFATPYTTLAYHMLRAGASNPAQQSAGGSVANSSLLEAGALSNFSSLSVESVGFGMSAAIIDVFTTPPILTHATTTIVAQQQVVQYRAAIEAFSTLLNDIHLSIGVVTSDELLELMGFDLYDDGMLNTIQSVWDIAGQLAQDPMTLQIVNTQYQVKDIVTLMKKERVLVGDSSGTSFLRENVAFNLQPIRAEAATEVLKTTPITAVNEPLITLSTTSIQFGNQDVGGVSGPKLVTLTNSGNAPLTISAISISSSPGFSQNNDCNRYLPVGSTCTFSISFTPISGGAVTGAIAISGNSNASPYRVKFSGTGKLGSTAVVTQLPRQVLIQSPRQVLQVDFDSHPTGQYTAQDAIDDFDADQSTGPGWSNHTNGSDIVADPTGDPTRGNVMRVTHSANKGGGGPRFKVRLPVADEYYLSYDVFIPKSNELMKQEKMPGLMYGSMLDATHAYGQKPQPEGVKALLAMIQLLKPGTYPLRGNTKQLTTYIYDADRVQYNRWFNLVDPVGSAPETTWSFPKGKWVKIEQRVKQNTATAQEGTGDLRDGILQTWVDGQLAVDRQYMHWRTVNTMHIDGVFFYDYYGGDPNDPENNPSKDQYTYFDNFVVSTSPITH